MVLFAVLGDGATACLGCLVGHVAVVLVGREATHT